MAVDTLHCIVAFLCSMMQHSFPAATSLCSALCCPARQCITWLFTKSCGTKTHQISIKLSQYSGETYPCKCPTNWSIVSIWRYSLWLQKALASELNGSKWKHQWGVGNAGLKSVESPGSTSAIAHKMTCCGHCLQPLPRGYGWTYPVAPNMRLVYHCRNTGGPRYLRDFSHTQLLFKDGKKKTRQIFGSLDLWAAVGSGPSRTQHKYEDVSQRTIQGMRKWSFLKLDINQYGWLRPNQPRWGMWAKPTKWQV